MSGKGGYQAPRNPAPVSGPGAMSRRTDGGPAQKLRDLPDAQYGEAATFRGLQQAAPLAASPGGANPVAPPGGQPMPSVDFGGPSTRPGEPVTTGAPAGAGAGPEILQSTQDPNQADLQRLAPMLPALEVLASLPTTSPETRNFIRGLRGSM